MSGATFVVQEGAAPLATQGPGIVLGTANQFQGLETPFKDGGPTRREDYLLRSNGAGLVLAGATELGLEHAVWDLLHRLGYRQFFPGAKWEIVPKAPTLSIKVDSFEQPDYNARRIWFGYGSLPENRAAYAQWQVRNRVTSGLAINTGHAYDKIISRNKAEFDKHPEYLATPGGNKFVVSNPGLRQLVIQDSLRLLEANPDWDSVSMDPSDGGGWDSETNPDKKVFKSISDRVITLANAVAEAINKKYPGKFVGVYAYNDHSPPPTIKVHPKVVVSVATAFIKGGFSVAQLMEGWSKQGAILGVREYYSVALWDQDLPGAANGANTSYLSTSIPQFHARGVRFMSAESSDNWAPNGLGYYLAGRLLWDVKEANRVAEIKADFVDKAFGSAREPMAAYFDLIDGANKPLISDDLRGRLYRHLDAALKATSDPAVKERILDLVLYTRYVELFGAYSLNAGEERQKAFEELLRYGWRIRDTHMIHTLGLWRSTKRDTRIKVPPGASYKVAEPQNPWKSSEKFTTDQKLAFLSEGITNNKLLQFKPVSFSKDLVPATPLKLKPTPQGDFKRFRGSNTLFTWVPKAPANIQVTMRHGLINQRKGGGLISVYATAETSGEAIVEKEVPNDQQPYEIKLPTQFEGLHTLEVNDRSSGCEFSWPEGTPMVVESSLLNPVRFSGGRWNLYFYVPRGTKILGAYAAGGGNVKDGDGKLVHTFTAVESQDYWHMQVPEGQDGKVWSLENMNGSIFFMTIPPYLARSAAELMVPAEVLQADLAAQ